MVHFLEYRLSLLLFETDSLFLHLQLGPQVSDFPLHRSFVNICCNVRLIHRWGTFERVFVRDLRWSEVVIACSETQLLTFVLIELYLHRIYSVFVAFDLFIQVLESLLIVGLSFLLSERSHLNLLFENIKLALIVAYFSLRILKLCFELIVCVSHLFLDCL